MSTLLAALFLAGPPARIDPAEPITVVDPAALASDSVEQAQPEPPQARTPATPEPPKDDARFWLERMNHVLATRNYEGTFFHLRHGKVESLRIVHRVEDNRISERLVSLDGNGREIIRNDGEQTCFLPDQRRVLVQPVQKRESGLLGTPVFGDSVDLHYRLEKRPSERISGRTTRVIAVTPRDNFRFGYCLWIDERTAMPLKTQLLDSKGGVIEQILWGELVMPVRIPKSAVQPRVRSEGFQWIRRPFPPEAQLSEGQTPWHATKLPPGFKLTDASYQLLEGASAPSTHLVYSDGLASVSVFIEVKPPEQKPMKGPSRVGSSYAYSTIVQGHQITAVGEVPVQTVRLIADSTRPEAASVAAEREYPNSPRTGIR